MGDKPGIDPASQCDLMKVLLESSPAFVLVIAVDGKIDYINRMLPGVKREDVIGWNAYDFVPPGSREKYQELVRKAVASGAHVKADVPGFGADGRMALFECTAIPLPDGRTAIHAVDVTAHREAVSDLRSERNIMSSILTALGSGMTIRDMEYNITYQNDIVSDLFGDRRGEKCYKVFEDIDHICHNCPVERSYTDGRAHTLVKQVVLPDGQVTYWENTSNPIRDTSGNIMCCLEMNRNVTEQVKAEQEFWNVHRQLVLAQKMEAIGHLAAGVAHDFNNMLAIIMGCAQLAIEDLEIEDFPETEAYREMHFLLDTAKRARGLTQNLLAFARGSKPCPEAVRVEPLVSDVVDLLKRTIQKKIRIVLSLSSHEKPLIADATQIQQAMLNIANNSADAMPDGGTLTISTSEVDLDDAYCRRHDWLKPGRFCLISISDTGSGIPNGTIEKVFDPFFTTKELGRGTGLGLSVTHGIIRSHGGHVDIISTPGEGTTIGIYLPFSDSDAITILDEQTKRPPQRDGTETLLFVDDEIELLHLLQRMLKRRGYNVIGASSGREAMEIYSKKHREIDLVILDFIMPEMNGMELFDELRKINPDIRAVIATGYAHKEDAADLLDAGLLAFLQKPFDIDEICRVIRDAVS